MLANCWLIAGPGGEPSLRSGRVLGEVHAHTCTFLDTFLPPDALVEPGRQPPTTCWAITTRQRAWVLTCVIPCCSATGPSGGRLAYLGSFFGAGADVPPDLAPDLARGQARGLAPDLAPDLASGASQERRHAVYFPPLLAVWSHNPRACWSACTLVRSDWPRRPEIWPRAVSVRRNRHVPRALRLPSAAPPPETRVQDVRSVRLRPPSMRGTAIVAIMVAGALIVGLVVGVGYSTPLGCQIHDVVLC